MEYCHMSRYKYEKKAAGSTTQSIRQFLLKSETRRAIRS
jgi:hypothetical protein